MRKLLSVLALTLAALVAVPGAASAARYGSTPGATLSTASVATGASFSFTASGFLAGARVTVSQSGSGEVAGPAVLTADGSGEVSAEYTARRSGDVTLTATGQGPDGELVRSASLTVVAAGTATRDDSSVLRSDADSDDDSDDNGSATASSSDSDGDVLPRTGADGVATQLWAGVGLLAVGGVLVGLTLRRRMTA